MSLSDERIRRRLEKLEREAREHPKRHSLRLLALVVLGYLYPALLATLTIGGVIVLLLLGPLVWENTFDARLLIIYVAAVIGAIALAVATLRTFAVKLPTPPGQPLTRDVAPKLWEVVERAREACGGPPIHAIHLDCNLNAAVAQRPRFGFFGPRKNYLMLGLPLLIGLTPEQLLVVLAHEFGHLRGRHNSFSAWIYRVQRTWESIGESLGTASKLRKFIIGWFAQWYGGHLAISTMALRRLHEHEADRRSAEACGNAPAGGALVAISWLSYRMDKDFWPGIIREAATQPLPPNDIHGRLSAFLAAPAPGGMLARFRQREIKSRTPITDEHPCLKDRLEAIDRGAVLASDHACSNSCGAVDPNRSAVSLLGAARESAWKIANASWKAIAIHRWRYEHASAKQLVEKAEKPKENEDLSPDDRAWEQARIAAQLASPEEEIAVVRRFVAEHPEHPGANYELGRLLLEQDDESAAGYLERAMRATDFIAPSLHLLLDYYRALGRDGEADPIRQRIIAHERDLATARKERLGVGKRDGLEVHDVSPARLQEIARVLFRYPRVQAAWLARKRVSLFADKPSYVMALACRRIWMDDNRAAEKRIAEAIAAQLPIACAVVSLRGRRWLKRRMAEACPQPVFVAPE